MICYKAEEDRKVLSEKLHEIRNIIIKELGRPNDKDLIFFPDNRFSIDNDGIVYFNGKNLSIKKTGKPRKVSGIFDAMGGRTKAIKNFNIAAEGPLRKLNTKEAAVFNKMNDYLPSTSKITQADDIELQEVIDKCNQMSTEEFA